MKCVADVTNKMLGVTAEPDPLSLLVPVLIQLPDWLLTFNAAKLLYKSSHRPYIDRQTLLVLTQILLLTETSYGEAISTRLPRLNKMLRLSLTAMDTILSQQPNDCW